MDSPGIDRDELVECLEDLARGNRLSGGLLLTLLSLSRLATGTPPGGEISILDVATGGGDFPRAMARWASRKGYVPRITATDVSTEILELSAGMELEASRPGPGGIHYETADALSLEYPDGSFDFATCSLFLHHLAPSDAVKLLGELGRVSRRGIVVNDLVRSWVGYFGTVAFTRVTSKNRLFRHDGPLSVRKAYTPREMRSLVRSAGLPEPRFVGIPGYRVAMTIPPGGGRHYSIRNQDGER
ncbi:MAG: methyltransferase domain-containing protein [Rubrobacteraceae bacterium]